MTRTLSMITFVAAIVAMTADADAVVNGQIDDFQTGAAAWQEGLGSPNPPFQNLNGGPGGVGDHSLRNVASGVPGAGGKMIMFNNAQWTGDYIAANVTGISAQMRVDPGGAGPLYMRVAFENPLTQQYVSSSPVIIPNDGVWYPVLFPVNAASMTQVGGAPTPLPNVLSNVSEMRILHATGPAWRGGNIPATLDVDNLTAIPEPATVALLLAAAPLALRRRRG